MDKTIKIINFINRYSKMFITDKIYQSSFIRKIRKRMENINFNGDDLNFIHTKKDIIIKKINNDKSEPILYKICKELEFPDNQINDYKTFLLWFRQNSRNINLKNIISRSSYNNEIYNNNNRDKLNKLLYENKFISLDIIHCGEIYDLVYNEYFYKYKNAETNIHIFTLDNKDKPNVVYIVKIINLLRKLSKKNLDIELTIFFCHQKRYLNKTKNKNLILTPENINAGSTLIGEFIYIWRREEFYKVLIHELIHYFMLDFSDFDNSYIEKIRNNIININGDDVINETYTELLAMTIYNIFYSLISKIDFNKIINYETIFTHFQIAKIINYFGGKEYNDLFKIEIKQSTSVASYVIFKGMFLNKYDNILIHYDDHFNSSRESKYNDYKKLYSVIVSKESLNKNLINHFLNIILNKNEKSNKFIMKSLRMTMFDI